MSLADMFGKLLFGKSFLKTVVSAQTVRNVNKDWEGIALALQQRQPSQLKQAVITADKCLDNALRDVVAGDNMGERLKNAEQKFDKPTYNKIWEAHKVRNNLVHESGYDAQYFVVAQSIESLKEGLKSLGVYL